MFGPAKATLRSIIIVLSMFAASHAYAQMPTPGGDAKDKPATSAADPLGRSTPLGMVSGFLGAAAEQNYERAAEYLDLRSERNPWGPSLARQLQRVLDQGGYVYSRLALSDDPAGNQNDNLMPNQERFGGVRTAKGNVDLIAERVEINGAMIWLVSAKTIADLPDLSRSVVSSLLDRVLPDGLRDYYVAGAPIGHWLAIVVLAFLAYGFVWCVTTLAWCAAFRTHNHFKESRIKRVLLASARPIRLFFAGIVLWVATILTGVSIVARQQLSGYTELLGWVTLAWIAWRVVDASGEFATERMTMRGRLSMLSAVAFLKRGIKVAIVVFAVIAGLNALGFNVTTGLAALGIGGIAIALGAQKTVEHLVGSLTIVADQPIRVGDMCRFDKTQGTVEDIGMRSTRIRTLDRTLVTVPNGNLAALAIENFSRRDKFWFHPMLDLRYETTADQMRAFLAGAQRLLKDHPKVDPDPARVRLIGFGESALRVEVFAYVKARHNDEFLEIQEELTLSLMDLVEDAGTGFASATPTIYLAQDRGGGSLGGTNDKP